MAYQYSLNAKKKDVGSGVCLFIDHKMAAIVKLFLSTFLVGYIYSFSGNIYEYIFNVGIYEIATYVTLPIIYYLMAFLVDKTNRVWIYRAGILLRTVLVVFAIFYGEDISKLIMLAGFLNGFSEGVYYSSYNTMTHEMVSRKNMKAYLVSGNVVGKLMDVIFPIVLGALIEVSTFAQVAIYVFVLCLIQIVISFGVRSKKPENSNFNLRQYFKDLKQNQTVNRKMKMIYWISFAYGFTTIITTLVNICIMMEFGSNFSLGIFTSIFAAVAIVTILIVNKVSKVGKRQILLCFVALIPVVFAILFAVMPNIYTLILYNFGNSAGWIIYRTIFDVHRNANLKEGGLYDGITEHQTFMEILFNVSRIISYGVMMLLGLWQNLIAFKVFLVLMICMASFTVILLLIYEKKFYPNISDEEKSYRIIKNCLLKDKI